MAGSALKNLRIFGKLCGDRAAERVILLSTMWDKIPADSAERRERELLNTFWKPMLDHNSQFGRFDRTFERGWSIVNRIADLSGPMSVEPMLLQEELSILGKHLSHTNAGIELYGSLQQLVRSQKEIIKRMSVEAKEDPLLRAALAKQYQKLESDLDKTLLQVQEMKVPLSQWILSFFSFRTARAHALEMGEFERGDDVARYIAQHEDADVRYSLVGSGEVY